MAKTIFLSFLIFLLSTQFVFADSQYVLPYPSSMPGTFQYKLRVITEPLFKLWYFGDLARFKYDLKQSDKYLVEAKTLFEYKQYLLAVDSLKKSDNYFEAAKKDLKIAEKRKNIQEQELILKEASLKHIEIIEWLRQNTPETFFWRPEKTVPTNLNIWRNLDASIKIREI